MALFKINDGVVIDFTNDGWAEFKKWLDGTYARLRYTWVDEGLAYNIIALDGQVYRTCSINKTDATEFEAAYKTFRTTAQNIDATYRDPNIFRRFGNLTAASTAEVLVAARAYVEQSSEAQRSVVSTSVQDAPAGTGAKKVRITYLTSAYVLKTEDVVLNGTTKVNTVASDIQFIENFKVIQGAAAVGAIKILDSTGGGGAEFCGISAATYDAFLCHHYVPAGKSGFVYGWWGCVDDETKFKLVGRATYGANVVDEHWDLHNLMGIATPPGHLEMIKYGIAVAFGEKAYIRITAIPNQSTSTVIRTELWIWEQ